MDQLSKKEFRYYANFLNRLATDMTKFYNLKLNKTFKPINKSKGKGYDPVTKADRAFEKFIRSKIQKKFPIPIICIGNIVVGGAGKTPVSFIIGKLLIKAGYRPHFISKGYAGLIKKTTLVQSWHSAISVGDESILLSKVAPTWIGDDRIYSSKLAKKEGSD